MDLEKYDIMHKNDGFIAALDQSGGSSAKTLRLYGINENDYHNEEEMFNMIHDMRTRIMTSNAFTNDKILGVILFEETMNRTVDGLKTPIYLWEKKHMLSFLKIDKGLKELADGVQLMKDIPNMDETLDKAFNLGVFGTKMRSVIKEPNKEAIKEVVKQQFEFATIIAKHNLVPIIEPEVDINAPEKSLCETILKEEVINALNEHKDMKVMFKFTLPTVDNFYLDLLDYENVVRIVALSGGYPKEEANRLLKRNKEVIASFSRALLEGLNVNQTSNEFDEVLGNNITTIADASINKEQLVHE